MVNDRIQKQRSVTFVQERNWSGETFKENNEYRMKRFSYLTAKE